MPKRIGKDIGCSFKYKQPKSSSPTLKKPVLSSTANHTSCITVLNQPVRSQPCQHKGSASNQEKVNISNTDDIHSCVTPKSHNISVPATSTPPLLTPLITTLTILPVRYQQQHNYPHLVKNICVSKLTTNLLMLLSVSNQEY